jgi:hypothetical protein
VYDGIFDDFPAKNAVYKPYIPMWFWPTLLIRSVDLFACRTSAAANWMGATRDGADLAELQEWEEQEQMDGEAYRAPNYRYVKIQVSYVQLASAPWGCLICVMTPIEMYVTAWGAHSPTCVGEV